jgi:hypothetical protein
LSGIVRLVGSTPGSEERRMICSRMYMTALPFSGSVRPSVIDWDVMQLVRAGFDMIGAYGGPTRHRMIL